jgi:hypothetical protein
MVVLWGLCYRVDCGTIWDQVGQLGESGEYRKGRIRVDYFHVRSSEGGSPYLCRLRTASVVPWGISIDYILAHMRFMGSHKLSSFDNPRVGWYPTLLNGCTLGLCVGHPRMPVEVSRGIHALGWGSTRPNSLIVITKSGHSSCLCDSRVSCCQVISLARLYIDSNFYDTHGYGWGLLAVFKHSNGTSLWLFWDLWRWHWLLCSHGLIITKCWLSYHACLAYVTNLLLLINITWLIIMPKSD